MQQISSNGETPSGLHEALPQMPGGVVWRILELVFVLLIMLVLPLVSILAYSVSPVVLVFGAAAWGIAFGLKLASAYGLAIIASPVPKPALYALVMGMLSGLLELGAAAVCFSFFLPSLELVDVMAFGFAASSIEIVYVLTHGAVDQFRNSNRRMAEQWFEGARHSLVVRHMMLLDRVVALIGHVASRTVIYFAVTDTSMGWLLFALITFACVDSVAIYGKTRKWNWCSGRVARAFYSYAFMIVSLKAAAAVYLAHIHTV